MTQWYFVDEHISHSPALMQSWVFCLFAWGQRFGALKGTVSANICAYFLHMSYTWCEKYAAYALFCIDFFIGIEAYFRFMGIILHCMGLKSMCGVFLPTHMPKYLYLKACVCVQEDVMKVIMLWVLIYTLSKMKKNKYLLSPPWAEVFRVLRESRVGRKRGIPIIPLKHLLLLMKELLLSCDFFFPVYLP